MVAMKRFVLLLFVISILAGLHAPCVAKANIKYRINPYKTSVELGCAANTPVPTQNYLRNIFQRIESIASIPRKDSYGKIGVHFHVDVMGNISNISVTKSSKDKNSDRAAVDSLYRAAPFGPAPFSFPQCGQDINFVFYLVPDKNATQKQAKMLTPKPASANQQSVVPQANSYVPSVMPQKQKILATPTNPYVPAVPQTQPQIPQNNYQKNYTQPAYQKAAVPQKTTGNFQVYQPQGSSNQFLSGTQSLISNISNSSYLPQYRNPMRYQYDSRQGDYFHTTQACLRGMGIYPNDYHFKSFPVKVWIQPQAPQIDRVIRGAVTEYQQYFPIQFVPNANLADMTIKIDPNLVYSGNVLGRGGLDYPEMKAHIELSPKLFNSEFSVLARHTIKHEIAHAMGVAKHSDDPNDLMFGVQRIDIDKANRRVNLSISGSSKPFERVGDFTTRDLNTLWRLYNE